MPAREPKLAPTLNWPQGNNCVQASLSLNVPAGKEIAFMHLHKVVANAGSRHAILSTI